MRLQLVILGTCAMVAATAFVTEARASGRLAPLGEKAEVRYSAGPSYTSAPTLPRNAQAMDQSAFAMGTMTWNVIFPQSDGTVTNPDLWTAGEIQTIQTKISEAEIFWEGMTAAFNPACRLAINVNYVNGGNVVTVPFDPSANQNEDWINSVMAQVGPYNSSSQYTNVRDFNQAQRVAAGTDWSTTIFAVHNTSYSRTSYAYAYLGGPFAIVENNPAGWGPQNFNMVLSHEMGHIFFANDEYYASGAKTTDHGGYLNQANLNAERDGTGARITPSYPNALMLNNGNYSTHVPFAPSPYSSQMYGFRDSDADGIPDILDTLASLTGNSTGSDPATGLFKFSGAVQVTQLANLEPINFGFSNSRSAMTIDTMAGAFYKLDDGALMGLLPQDGTWDGYSEDFAFTIPGLARGAHTIDVYGVNNVGNASNTLHFDFQAVPEPSTVALLAAGVLALLAYSRRK